MAEATRIRLLRDEPPREGGRYVQYWMQQAMRAEANPALDYAIETANALELPVLVSFGLTGGRAPAYPDANARHYAFLLQGLAEVEATLERLGIAFVIRDGAPPDVTLDLGREAALLVCDRGYLRPQREWQAIVRERAGCRMVEVETDAVAPVETVSTKHEFAARTIRPKIMRLVEEYLVDHPQPKVRMRGDKLRIRSDIDLSKPLETAKRLKVDQSVGPVRRLQGGLAEARRRLADFLGSGFDGYAENRSEPHRSTVSHLSPSLHFGQISPVEVALAARAATSAGRDDRASFLEELIVRRELSQNHCWFEPRYDSYDSIPDWARKALDEKRGDPRPYLYSRSQLEAGETHDRYWNAAMREMRETGYMHNRLRMYWGKKIIEWTPSPEEAFATTLAINNRYFVDGRDANSFTNVAWLFGLHDRPWFRRPIFGTVRYLGDNTLRKFDAEAYVRSVEELCAAEG